MARAGQVAFELVLQKWPGVRHITVVTGSGNNAGDGYVVALLARKKGIQVDLLELGERQRLSEDAAHHANLYIDAGGDCDDFEKINPATQLIVDAILGTGLNTPVKGRWARAIHQMNNAAAPVLALDIPSGLHADTGAVMGVAVKAAATISFIGLKQGMFTGCAREFCGKISFHALDIPARIYASEILGCRRVDWLKQKLQVTQRHRTAHKGSFGHVLIVGGCRGYSGAVKLAAEAALRAGAGLVSVATHSQHAACLNQNRPEMMVHAIESADQLEPLLLKHVSAVVVGPGLGQGKWGLELLHKVLQQSCPMVIDADALNLIAAEKTAALSALSGVRGENRVMTPHPGEAARLLGCSVAEIEADRFKTISELRHKFDCHVVLKGAGSLIASPGNMPLAVCSDGNPGMATGGMGDVLAGILGCFMAQPQAEMDDAVKSAVCLHSAAGDKAAERGEIGMLASDLFGPIRALLNRII